MKDLTHTELVVAYKHLLALFDILGFTGSFGQNIDALKSALREINWDEAL